MKLELFANNFESYLNNDKVLYPHQREVFEKIIQDVNAGNLNGALKAPTGIGKTILIGSAVNAFTSTINERALILVPRKVLAEQTQDELTNIIGIDENKIGVYHSGKIGSERKNALNKQILITTPSSLINLGKNGIITEEDFGYISLDEAHRMNGPRTRVVLDRFIENAITHAWSATPTFYDGTTISETLFDRDDFIFELNFKTAVEKGYLSPVKNIILQTNVDTSDLGAPTRELSALDQRRFAMRAGRDDLAISLSKEFIDVENGVKFADETSVWYSTGIDHAKAIKEKLNAVHGEGYAELISGKTSKDRITKLLKAHKHGDLKALVNAQMLVEGWDNPKASIAYMLVDSVSPIKIEQTGGRVTRIDKERPEKQAYVVNLVDEGRPFSLTYSDVVGGNNIKPPKRKINNLEGEKAGFKPNYDYSETFGDLLIVTSEEHIKFTKKRKEMQDELTLEDVPEGFLSKYDFSLHLRTSYKNEKYNELWDSVKESGQIGNHKIKSGYFSSSVQTAFFVHRDEVEKFKEKLGVKESKPDGYLGKEEFSRKLKTMGNKQFTTLWDQVEKTGQIGNQKIRSGIFRMSTKTAFCVHQDEIEKFKKELGIKESKPDGYLSKSAVAKKLKITFNNKEFSNLWDSVEKTRQIGDQVIQSGFFRSGNATSFSVHQDEIEKFKKELGIKESKPDGYLSKTELSRQLGVQLKSDSYLSLWNKVMDTGTIGDDQIKSGFYISGSHASFYIHQDEIEKLKKELGIKKQRPEGYLGKEGYAKKLKITSTNKEFSNLWDNVEKTGKIADQVIKSGSFRSGNHTRFFVHRDEVEKFKEKLGRKDLKPDGYLGKEELSRKLKTMGNKEFSNLWDNVEKTGKIADQVIKSGFFRSGNNTRFFIHEDEAPKFKESLNIYPQKPEGYRSLQKFAMLLKGFSTKSCLMIELWEEVEKTGKIDGEDIKCGLYKSGSHTSFSIHQDEADKFKEKLEEMKTERNSKPSNQVKLDSIEKAKDGDHHKSKK